MSAAGVVIATKLWEMSTDKQLCQQILLPRKLSNTLSSIKDNNEIFILGDLTARTGREHNDPVVGQYGEATINDNGKRLRD